MKQLTTVLFLLSFSFAQAQTTPFEQQAYEDDLRTPPVRGFSPKLMLPGQLVLGVKLGTTSSTFRHAEGSNAYHSAYNSGNGLGVISLRKYIQEKTFLQLEVAYLGASYDLDLYPYQYSSNPNYQMYYGSYSYGQDFERLQLIALAGYRVGISNSSNFFDLQLGVGLSSVLMLNDEDVRHQVALNFSQDTIIHVASKVSDKAPLVPVIKFGISKDIRIYSGFIFSFGFHNTMGLTKEFTMEQLVDVRETNSVSYVSDNSFATSSSFEIGVKFDLPYVQKPAKVQGTPSF